MLKILYGACLGLMTFTMTFLAPSGKVLTSSAAPDRVQRDTSGPPGRTGTTSGVRSRYVFIGSYGK